MVWRRRKSVVNLRQQLWFALELTAVAIGFNFLCAFFLFVPPFSDLIGGETPEWLLTELQKMIFLKWPMIMIALLVLVVIGVLMSHRMWGPLYGLERVIH